MQPRRTSELKKHSEETLKEEEPPKKLQDGATVAEDGLPELPQSIPLSQGKNQKSGGLLVLNAFTTKACPNASHIGAHGTRSAHPKALGHIGAGTSQKRYRITTNIQSWASFAYLC